VKLGEKTHQNNPRRGWMWKSYWWNLGKNPKQPRRGWRIDDAKTHSFTFSGKSFAELNFCLKGYSHSTPSGLGPLAYLYPRFHLFRQKFRGAKLLPERLFTFNPFGVGASMTLLPQVAPVAIHIQPLRGWCLDAKTHRFHIQPLRGWRLDAFTTGCTCGYSLSFL